MEENIAAAVTVRLADALAKGDIEQAVQYFADDAVWHLLGKSVVSGDYKGREAIMRLLQRVFQMTGGTFRLKLIDIMASAEYVALWPRITAARGGKMLDVKLSMIFKVCNGKIVETWNHRQPALDAFLS